jgi:single-stranded-DNA-specific exonuclease
MKLKWLYRDSEDNFIKQILDNRNKSKDEYQKTIDDLPDDFLLKDLDVAVERILNALYSNERIVIFGHDDPDGVTATYLLYDFFETCGFQNHYYYIPNRLVDHHGIQDSCLSFLAEKKADLLITVDNGISSKDKVEEIKAMGIDVIITDHHLFDQENIPLATAVVNPKRSDCSYPYDMIAGVGVSLMLVRGLAKRLEKEIKPAYYFWTAVGSLADRVPMADVNWVIVRHVLDKWDKIKGNTIDMLKSICNPIHTYYDKLSFLTYSYRMIANGREVDGQHHGLRFMLAKDREKYDEFALIQNEKKANEHNLFALNTIISELLSDYNGDGLVYIDKDDRIPNPLLGTCATFLVNTLYEPVLMLKERDGLIICEGRCSEGFSVLDAFKYCEDALIQYGGHVRAGGFTMKIDNLDKFLKLYKEYFQTQLETIEANKTINIDAVIDVSELDNNVIEQLDFMLPFGHDNSEPMFLVNNYDLSGNHHKLNFDNGLKNKLQDNKIYQLVVQISNSGQAKVIDYREVNEDQN